MSTRFVKISLFILIVCLVNVQSASAAYIDPNTGGMVFQLLAVLFGVISGLILVFSSRIKMLFFRVMRKVRHQEEPESEPATVEEG
jgi:hypothetical protein